MQFFLLQSLLLLAVMVVFAVITVLQNTNDFRETRGNRVLASAENLASTDLVRTQLIGALDKSVLAPDVQRVKSLSGATDVSIANIDDEIIASTSPQQLGLPLELGSQTVLRGGSWSGDLTIDHEVFLAAQVPIFNLEGAVIGAVSVAEAYPSFSEVLESSTPDIALLLGCTAVLVLGGSIALAQVMRHGTRNLDSREIAGLADHREALLYGIREGVVGVDRVGRITVVNDSARRLLELDRDITGSKVIDLPLSQGVKDILLAGESSDVIVEVNARLLLTSSRPATRDDRLVGWVTTLRDRTDLVNLEGQLANNKDIVNTLRAQSHEFANQLHAIYGLLELGDQEHARTYIGQITQRQRSAGKKIAASVADPTLASLILAKSSVAEEVQVQLKLDPRSKVPPLKARIVSDAVTVLGNLVDNAIRATPVGGTVEIRLEATDTALEIQVKDSGSGVPEDFQNRIFERGFTTKDSEPTAHGIGLSLVRLICARRNGHVRVENNNGAVFTAVLPYRTMKDTVASKDPAAINDPVASKHPAAINDPGTMKDPEKLEDPVAP